MPIAPSGLHANKVLDFGHFFHQGLSERGRGAGLNESHSPRSVHSVDAEDLIRVFVESIVAQLILYPDEDENTGGYPDGQASDVDERKTLVPFDLAEGDFYIAPDKRGHDVRRMPVRAASLVEFGFFVLLSEDIRRSGLFERRTEGRFLIKTCLDLMVDLIPEVGFQLRDVGVLQILTPPEGF